jgi:DNA-binding NtrC family response regulator
VRILVVEDDPGVRSTVVRMLEYLGHTVAAVATGDDADRLPDDQPFEVVLADLRLPGMLGHRVVGRLRERWPHLKAVIMSGNTDHDEVRAGVLDGRWRLLPKPFDFEQLASQLRDPSEPAVSTDT